MSVTSKFIALDIAANKAQAPREPYEGFIGSAPHEFINSVIQIGQDVGNAEAVRVQAEVSSAAELAKTGSELNQRVGQIITPGTRALSLFSPQLQSTITKSDVAVKTFDAHQQMALEKIEENNLIHSLNSVSNKFASFDAFKAFSSKYVAELGSKRALSPMFMAQHEALLKKAEIYYASPALGNPAHTAGAMMERTNQELYDYREAPGEEGPGEHLDQVVADLERDFAGLENGRKAIKEGLTQYAKELSSPEQTAAWLNRPNIRRYFSPEDQKMIIAANVRNVEMNNNDELVKKDSTAKYVSEQNARGIAVPGVKTNVPNIDKANKELEQALVPVNTYSPEQLMSKVREGKLDVSYDTVNKYTHNFYQTRAEDYVQFVKDRGILNDKAFREMAIPIPAQRYDKDSGTILNQDYHAAAIGQRLAYADLVENHMGRPLAADKNIFSAKEIAEANNAYNEMPTGVQYDAARTVYDAIENKDEQILAPVDRLDAPYLTRKYSGLQAIGGILQYDRINPGTGKGLYYYYEEAKKRDSKGLERASSAVSGWIENHGGSLFGGAAWDMAPYYDNNNIINNMATVSIADYAKRNGAVLDPGKEGRGLAKVTGSEAEKAFSNAFTAHVYDRTRVPVFLAKSEHVKTFQDKVRGTHVTLGGQTMSLERFIHQNKDLVYFKNHKENYDLFEIYVAAGDTIEEMRGSAARKEYRIMITREPNKQPRPFLIDLNAD